MTISELMDALAEMSRVYLRGGISGRAFARGAESVIATSELEDEDTEVDSLGLAMASFSPGGGDGLIDESDLRRIAERLAKRGVA